MHAPAKAPCSTERLAASRVCRVERCCHGTVHVTLGALTLRITEKQLAEIANTLEAARLQIAEELGFRAERVLC